MSMMQPGRFIKAMNKSAAVLKMTLQNLTQEQATTARDGAEGWTVLEVLCHLRDYNDIFFNRALLCYNQDNPAFAVSDHLQLVIDNRYAEQNFAEVLASYLEKRQKFVNWLAELPEPDWHKTGIHPESGQVNILEIAMQTALHDLDHLEQIQRSLQGAL